MLITQLSSKPQDYELNALMVSKLSFQGLHLWIHININTIQSPHLQAGYILIFERQLNFHLLPFQIFRQLQKHSYPLFSIVQANTRKCLKLLSLLQLLKSLPLLFLGKLIHLFPSSQLPLYTQLYNYDNFILFKTKFQFLIGNYLFYKLNILKKMIDKRFEHLFPSPGLEEASKFSRKTQLGCESRKNNHMNHQNLRRRQKDIKDKADQFRKMTSANYYKFLCSVKSMQKIRNSLSPQSSIFSKEKAHPFLNMEKPYKKNLYEKTYLRKTAIQQTPMIFIQGQHNLMSDPENKTAQLGVQKIINYTSKQMDSISCRVIATTARINKNEVELYPDDYEIALAGYLPTILARGNLKQVSIKGEWIQPQKKRRLYLLLVDESKSQILFITKCYNLQEITKKALQYQKVEQSIC